MGGASNVIIHAKKAFADGEYAWAAELLNKVVFAKLKNEAKLLNANTLEQLGYQANPPPWRNEYLTAYIPESCNEVGKVTPIN